MQAIEIEPVARALGAEVHGLDLTQPLSNRAFARMREAFHAHSVIFIRCQEITPEQYLAFARRFGPIDVNRFFTPVDDHPESAEVRKEPEQKKSIGERWHTDHSYDAAPAMVSALLAREAAYRDSDIASSLHNSDTATQDATHPVVIRHPKTGRKALYVDQNISTGIEGWTPRTKAQHSWASYTRIVRRPSSVAAFGGALA